jgi:6-phosphogluconolactonase (cycloisomerase 2 family)
MALFLASTLVNIGCGGMSTPTVSSTPITISSQFLYVTGEIQGDRTQIFGYRIQMDGTLSPLALPSLIAPYCCHQATSSGSVLYIADFGGGVAAMSSDPQSGQLTALPGSPFPGPTASASGTPTACGKKFLYVTNGYPGGIFAFTIDSKGALNAIPGSPFPTGMFPGQPVLDPLCRFLFVTNSSDGSPTGKGGLVYAYTVDAVTGNLSSVDGSPFTVGRSTSIMHSIAVDTNGNFLYVPDHDSQTISGFSIASTGALTPLTGSPFKGDQPPFFALAVGGSAAQFLYVANAASNSLSEFAIDSVTGQLTLVSDLTTTSQPSFLVSSGNFLYSFNVVSGNVSSNNINVFSVNQDGTLHQISMDGTLAYFPVSAAVSTSP